MRYNLFKNWHVCVLALLLLVITACGSSKKITLVNSTSVPGAEGTVKVKKDKNENYLIDVSIENLATSKQLTPSKNSYVAWMETKENGTKNIGQVNSSKGMLSKTRRASLTTVSSFKPTRIFITAEDNPSIEAPGGAVIMTTEVF